MPEAGTKADICRRRIQHLSFIIYHLSFIIYHLSFTNLSLQPFLNKQPENEAQNTRTQRI
jgi:hypothetical protein